MTQLRTAPDALGAEPFPGGPRSGLLQNTPLDLSSLESIRSELRKLSATNQEILKSFQPATPNGSPKLAAGEKEEAPDEAVDVLRAENEALLHRVEELEAELQAATPEGWAGQQQAFEQLLEEKSDVIRELNQRIHELNEALTGGPAGPGREELQQMQRDIEERQQRLVLDEEALQQQLREMEMSMARERADLARQRAELQRLHTDVHRELEAAQRDPALRERLAKLQNLASEGRPRSMTTLPDASKAAAPPAPRRPSTMAAIDLDDFAADESRKTSGFFRRIFGG
jgi:DNA repair exonuclease SbcCD ATPase subunit